MPMQNYTTQQTFDVPLNVDTMTIPISIPTTGSVTFGVWNGVSFIVDAADTATATGNKVLFGVAGTKIQITPSGTGVSYAIRKL